VVKVEHAGLLQIKLARNASVWPVAIEKSGDIFAPPSIF
jgi:hypothetical protein